MRFFKNRKTRRPDIVFVDEEESKCFIDDIVVPEDAHAAKKEKEQIEKCQDVKRDIRCTCYDFEKS